MSSTLPPSLFGNNSQQLSAKAVGKFMKVNTNDLVEKQLSYRQFDHKVT